MTWLPNDPLRGDDTGIDYFLVILAYSRERLRGLARKVVYRLQRLPATGVFGDDYGFKTSWDEFFWYCQKGYEDTPIESVFEDCVEGLVLYVLGLLTDNEATLLTCAVCDELQNPPARDDGELCRAVRELVWEKAGRRNLDRFEGW